MYILTVIWAARPRLLQIAVVVFSISFTFLFLTDLLPRVAIIYRDQEPASKMVFAFHQYLVEGKYQEAATYTYYLQPDELAEYWSSIKINGEENTKIERITLTSARRYYMLPEGDGDKYVRRYLLEAQYFTPEGLLGSGQIFVEFAGSIAKIRLLKAM